MTSLSKTILPEDKPQIITTRLLSAPRDLVWKVLTTPEHIKHFWGPDGFRNSIKSMDVKVDGQWLFTMHGPDGKDWPNRIIYREIDPPRYMRWDHDNGGASEFDHKFVGELELFEEEGGKTRIELRVNEASMAARDNILSFGVAEGGKQNLDRLAAYVAPMADEKNMFVIERTYPVAQERLFQACTRVEEMKQWFAPPGMTVIKAEQNLKPGGTYHYGLAMPNGGEMWGKVTYTEITPHSRVVYLQSFSDRDGGITKHPMSPTWPLEMVTQFEFIPEGPNSTKLKISWIYAGIDDEEGQTFRAAHASMSGGWTGTLDSLQKYLAAN
ncbi:SRPBCC family protein [Aestuariivirga litoralis]|uniref:SRPBCC family protein n=1 Tax=Aestuariivirga litoralis TaxID=2650924 RepID=UPI0018C7149F|nr:SRPBCC family protein [Aestuariivirga litoralis]MBG1233089.1 hypothetical protein [Aestuariivirga litoralis]